MKLHRMIATAAGVIVIAAGIFTAPAQPTDVVTTAPVYVPDYSHATEPLPAGVFVWDLLSNSADATNGQDFARFAFNFTNVTAGNATILSARGSCSCTTVQLPPVPWIIPPGTNGRIGATIDLAGKSGRLSKSVFVVTDKGSLELKLSVNILPPPVPPTLTEQQRMVGIMAAKVDRQAIFKGDCAACHAQNLRGKYGENLFHSVCAVCHEAENRATMVPDLRALKVATNGDFWRTWITYGKPGTLMPAFANSQGGPLTEMQIFTLVQYLGTTHPSLVPPVQ